MNTQLDLDFSTAYDFDGVCYDPALDSERLNKQLGRVYNCIKDGEWRTVQEIAAIIREPENSIGAQLRNLRKVKYGYYDIIRRRRGDKTRGLHEFKFNGKKL